MVVKKDKFIFTIFWMMPINDEYFGYLLLEILKSVEYVNTAPL